MEEGIVWFLDLHQSFSHSLVKGIRLGVVENHLHHVLKFVRVCWHDIVLALLKGIKEFGLDAVDLVEA